MLLGLINLAFSSCIALRTQCTTGGKIALIFEDGPARETAGILNNLDKLKVPASFNFAVNHTSMGNIAGLYRRAVDDGHTVGLRLNPSRPYDDMQPKDIESDIDAQMRTITRLTGEDDIMFAKASVDSDGQPNQDVYDVLRKKGIMMSSYNYCPYHSEAEDPMEEFDQLLSGSNKTYDSFIILLHDEQEAYTPYVKQIVEIGQSHGYTFVTLEECFEGYNGDQETADGAVFRPKETAGVESITAVFLPLLVLLTQFM